MLTSDLTPRHYVICVLYKYIALGSKQLLSFNTEKTGFLFLFRIKMPFCILHLFCFLTATTLVRPSKVQEDGITSSDGDDVFIMRKSDLRKRLVQNTSLQTDHQNPWMFTSASYEQLLLWPVQLALHTKPRFPAAIVLNPVPAVCLSGRSWKLLRYTVPLFRSSSESTSTCTARSVVALRSSEDEPKPDGSWRSSKFKIAGLDTNETYVWT